MFTSLFGLFTSLRLVKYKPACKQAAGLEWLGRSDFEPGCLSSLVRRRWFALRGTRVQAPASPSPKILQKSSKSEKTRGPGDAPSRLLVFLACLLVLRPVYCIFCLVYWLSGLFTCLGASASVLFSLPSILKSCLEPLLCLFGPRWDSNQGSRCSKFGF